MYYPQSGSALQTPTHPLLAEHFSCNGGALLMVTSVNQVTPYQVCSHAASVCLVYHVLHGNCPDVITFGSQHRAVAFYSRGE